MLINKTSVPRRRPGGRWEGRPLSPGPSDPLTHNFSPEACSGWGSEPGRAQARFGKLLVETEAQTVPPRVPRPVTGGEPRGHSDRPELRAASRRKGLAWVLADGKEPERRPRTRTWRGRAWWQARMACSRRQETEQAHSGLWQGGAGSRGTHTILEAVGSHSRVWSRRVRLSDLGFTQSPWFQLGERPSGPENGVRKLAGYCTRPGTRPGRRQ